MSALLKQVRAEATVRQLIRNAPDGKRLDAFVKQGYDKDHWFANFRQYYMRHMVYKLTLDRTYGVLTFWRDDNVFLTPLDLGPMWPKLLASTNAVWTYVTLPGHVYTRVYRHVYRLSVQVFVNQYCGFGALSDKIYAFNRGSVDLFFCPTFQSIRQEDACMGGVGCVARRHQLAPIRGLAGALTVPGPNTSDQVGLSSNGHAVCRRRVLCKPWVSPVYTRARNTH